MARRYIELDNFISTVKATPRCDLATALMIANNYSTADVEEVKHGEWKHKRATIDGNLYFYCSECGREVSVNIYDNTSVTKFYPYCHCGAKMDGRK